MRIYLDGSALVKLLLVEDGSSTARELYEDAAAAVTTRVGYVEARAALAAARRARRIGRDGLVRARAALEARWSELDVVELDEPLAVAAAAATEEHALRAHDAVHLSAALVLEEAELVVATWDADLKRAALASGLAVAPA